MNRIVMGLGVLLLAAGGLFAVVSSVSAEETVVVTVPSVDQTSETVAISPQASTERMDPRCAKCYWPKFRSCMKTAGFGKADGRTGKSGTEECQRHYYASGQTMDCHYAFQDCNRSSVSECRDEQEVCR